MGDRRSPGLIVDDRPEVATYAPRSVDGRDTWIFNEKWKTCKSTPCFFMGDLGLPHSTRTGFSEAEEVRVVVWWMWGISAYEAT